jgi:EAL domain-containing protein (putative c-di-GMP-specific phosphodiesterase class I)
MQENYHEGIMELLEHYNVSPKMINLEITETAAAYSEDRLVRNMARMSLMDITFSMDDYGSGYSNVNYLVDMPFSIIKLDKYFVWAAFKKVKMRKILENTISMFHDINLKVVAEGVEDEEMVNALTQLGVEYLQGYYYSKPLPRTALMDLLQGVNA